MNKKLIVIPLVAACGGNTQDPSEAGPQTIEVPCTPEQGGAYADGIPYQGIHADAGNSDVIACESASAYVESWFSLRGLGLTQPNTFSPDGSVLYVTTAIPDPEGCRVHALRSDTGDALRGANRRGKSSWHSPPMHSSQPSTGARKPVAATPIRGCSSRSAPPDWQSNRSMLPKPSAPSAPVGSRASSSPCPPTRTPASGGERPRRSAESSGATADSSALRRQADPTQPSIVRSPRSGTRASTRVPPRSWPAPARIESVPPRSETTKVRTMVRPNPASRSSENPSGIPTP